MQDTNPSHGAAELQAGAARRTPSTAVTLKRLFGFVAPERGRLVVACAAMSIASLNNLAFPRLVAALLDNMAAGGKPGVMRRTLLGSLVLFAVGGLGSWVRTYLFNTACDSVARRLRKQMVDALMRQDTAYFDQVRVGDLMSRLADDVTVSASAATNNLAKGYRYANSAIGGSVILLLLSPRLTAVSLAIVPLLGISGMSYGMYARKLSKRLKERASEMASRMEERLSSIHTVRLFAMELPEAAEYARLLDATAPMVRAAASAEGTLMGGLAFAGFSSLMGVLCYGGTLVAKGHLSVGALTSFVMYSATVGLGFSGLSQLQGEMMKAVSSAERVFEVIDRLPDVDQHAGETLPEVKGRMELRNVHFQYPSRPDALVLAGVTLILEPEAPLALVGPSGAGKSTVAALLARLYEPTSGVVLLDGVDVRTLSASWLRTHISVVNQEPVLLADSILANITYGCQGATEAEAMAAAETANARQFIEALPDGVRTYVGEQGSQLSGGQKQRVAIARAVLRDPRVLLLDEATSALDNESERLVRDALDRVMKGRSVLLIAHRASTIAAAPRVAVLDAGVVVEQGSQAELAAREGGAFHTLMRARATPA